MALFDAGSSCGLWGLAGWPTWVSLVFDRATTHSATTYGHIGLSFTSAYTVRIDMQPGGGNFFRLLHGQLEPIDYTGVVQGFVDMQNGDRTSHLSSLLEIINVNHFGTYQTTCQFHLLR